MLWDSEVTSDTELLAVADTVLSGGTQYVAQQTPPAEAPFLPPHLGPAVFVVLFH